MSTSGMPNPWPITLHTGDLTLRPLRLRDKGQWDSVRAQNLEWLTPWQATIPQVSGASGEIQAPSYIQMVRTINREARAGRSYSFGIFLGATLVGQISMGGVIYGALRAAHIGYWIDRRYHSRGYTTAAVSALTEYGFNALGLHRIEINVRPENAASIRVAEKCGYFREGERARFLHIDGAWRDHVVFVRENSRIS